MSEITIKHQTETVIKKEHTITLDREQILSFLREKGLTIPDDACINASLDTTTEDFIELDVSWREESRDVDSEETSG